MTNVRLYRVGGTALAATRVRVYRIGAASVNTSPSIGPNQIVQAYQTVTITATDAETTPVISQVGGPSVGTLGGSGGIRTFIAPATLAETVYTFQATDGSFVVTMTVTVRCHNEWASVSDGLGGGVLVPIKTISI